MISCRNHSSRYTRLWAGGIQIKPPQHLGSMGTESTHRTGLLTCGAFVRLGNHFEQHSKQWFQEGEKSYVFIIMQSKMIALNEWNRIELVLVCWAHIKEGKMESGPVLLFSLFLLGDDTIQWQLWEKKEGGWGRNAGISPWTQMSLYISGSMALVFRVSSCLCFLIKNAPTPLVFGAEGLTTLNFSPSLCCVNCCGFFLTSVLSKGGGEKAMLLLMQFNNWWRKRVNKKWWRVGIYFF